MLDLVVGTRPDPVTVDLLVKELNELTLTDGTLYIGYPIVHTTDSSLALDAILTCVEYGIVIFDLNGPDRELSWDQVEERQADYEIAIKSKLLKHKALTNRSRELAVPVTVVTYLPHRPNIENDAITVGIQGQLIETLKTLRSMDRKFIRPLNAAIQQVATIKPVNKRLNVKSEKSKGGKLKVIEREVANLDRWQKKGAIECPDGPQRIRGLAGSGKTVVLALKAAYLHAQHPNWRIAVSFQTKSLYDQFRDLIRRFTFEHLGDEPDWDRLQVLHAWGSNSSPGIYSLITQANGLPCRDYTYGKNRYYSSAFEGVCGEALDDLGDRQIVPIFDALLIDEAQDFGPNFFRLAYLSVKEPHMFVFAYDELQSLKETSLPALAQLFGTDKHGEPIVQLPNRDGQPQRDVILPVCYRNTPWTLSMAHALGFGIYNQQRLIQMFDQPALWKDIGYEAVAGHLREGQPVTLARRKDATPKYFEELLTPDEALGILRFDDADQQAAWVAEQIQENIEKDELQASDILVIFANPVTVSAEAPRLMFHLRNRGIASHIAGVTNRANQFFVDASVVISGIYRAKGNEAAMVYVLGAEYCFEGPGLIRRRNILFTAMTRSRAWLRVCGVGQKMDYLKTEWDAVIDNKFNLAFTLPTMDQLVQIRRIHRDRTDEETMKIEQGNRGLEQFVDLLETGELSPEDVPIHITDSSLAKVTTLTTGAGSRRGG